jgi:hypothetical protein
MANFPVKLVKSKSNHICPGCEKGKMVSKLFPELQSRVKENFELIHSDLKQMPVLFYHKYKYFIIFIDDKSSAHWVQCIKPKSKAKKAILEFEVLVYKVTIRCWHIDAGGEFINFDLIDTLKGLGIAIEQSVPYQHQQNGHTECAIRTITEKAQVLHFVAYLLPSCWEFTIEHAVHLYNKTPKWQTPMTAITREILDVSLLTVFDCGAYMYLPQEKWVNKLVPRSELITYLSTITGIQGY